jgi:chondroitin AC lyase
VPQISVALGVDSPPADKSSALTTASLWHTAARVCVNLHWGIIVEIQLVSRQVAVHHMRMSRTCLTRLLRFTFPLLPLLPLLLSSSIAVAAPAGSTNIQSVDPDLELIRARVTAYVMRSTVNETRVERLLGAISTAGSWPHINYEDVSRTGFQHSEHLANMVSMATAYKKPGNRFTGDPDLKRAVHAALDFWIEHDFRCDNWWWNDMGTPLAMINLLLIMDSDLTDTQREAGLRIAGRANMRSAGARPGGDLIRVATMWGKQGLFTRNTEILEEVVRIIAAEMHTTTGRGLKPDLSHHHRHDNVISTLSYGLYLPSQFATWALFIQDTRFSFPRSATELVVDFFLDGICRSMPFGRYPDVGARNRGISRRGALSPAGPGMADDLYRVSHHRRDELKAIADIRRGERKPDLRYTSFFWHSEYFIHQRPDWFASVRMHSARNHNVEQPHNEEGLKNHHLGDGANYLTRTGREYVHLFPAWDWQQIPGTTVLQKPGLPHWNQIAKRGRTAFVGGVTDGEHGAAVFDFESPHDPLRARKSWFFFEDEYVCLGSGIAADAAFPVHTTLDQRHLQDEVWVGQHDTITRLDKGRHALETVSWVHHDRVAYLFPAPADLNLRNTTATGSWRSITHQAWATDQEITADVFALWFDHGIQPRDANYQYVVVPNLDRNDLQARHRNLPIRILSNSTVLQAVRHDDLQLIQMVFYEPGEIELNTALSLSVDIPCAIMVRLRDNQVDRITVSDPARVHEKLELVVRGPDPRQSAAPPGTSQPTQPARHITVDLPRDEWAGRSVVLDIAWDSRPPKERQ